jgi:hypothetical protein
VHHEASQNACFTEKRVSHVPKPAAEPTTFRLPVHERWQSHSVLGHFRLLGARLGNRIPLAAFVELSSLVVWLLLSLASGCTTAAAF